MSRRFWPSRAVPTPPEPPSPPQPPPPPEAETVDPFDVAMSQADAARDSGDWSEAATHYALAVEQRLSLAGPRVQLGHALKESGRLADAETAYRAAASADPTDPDPWLHIGHALKVQGQPAAALDAYAAALERDPTFAPARQELIAAGARDRLPWPAAEASLAAALAEAESALQRAKEARDELATSAVGRWNAFRKRFPTPPPPPDDQDGGVTVIIEAHSADASALRWTLRSLLDQSDNRWTAQVLADPAVARHAVGSLAATGARIRFVSRVEDAAPQDLWMPLEAGERLDPQAIAWLRFARHRTRADIIYADHDYWSASADDDAFENPALQSFPDADDLASTPFPPAIVALAGTPTSLSEPDLTTQEQRRRLLLQGLARGSAAHLPRVLGSLPVPATLTPSVSGAGAAPIDDDASILVVVPTHDQPELLTGQVESLIRCATKPERLHVIIVENRATERARRAIEGYRGRDGVTIMAVDEPFNWSRLNNLAAKDRREDLFVFANDDMEMLTPGWDDRLRTLLQRPEVGALGAQLFYPTGAHQHAGLLLGQGSGRPFHEGVGQPQGAGGPLGRWRRTRRAAAVTGAFIACRRKVFERLDGFDAEHFAVAYNDIDFCLRVRAAGLDILYAAAIQLIHHESITRGRNHTREQQAWDDAEWFDLKRRWGDTLLKDPSINPQWSSVDGHPFDGYREPSLETVLAHLDDSARANPWRVDPPRARSVM